MRNSLVFIFLASVSNLIGQEVIGSSGGTMNDGSISMDYTLGEVVIFTGSNGTNDLTQGFHQTNWQFSSIDVYQVNYTIALFPNPTTNNLVISTEQFEGLHYLIFDSNGKIILNGELQLAETTLDVSNLAQGKYTVTVSNQDSEIQSYHLIKIQ